MPCRMSPKSNIQVQSNPMENHSTGMLMNVMEIPRAKMTLEGQKQSLFLACKERTEPQQPKLCMRSNTRTPSTAGQCHLLPANPAELSPCEQLGQMQLLIPCGFNGQEEKLSRSHAPSEPGWREGTGKRPFLSLHTWILGATTTLVRVLLLEGHRSQCTNPNSLLQQDRSTCHQCDPSPVPDHDD